MTRQHSPTFPVKYENSLVYEKLGKFGKIWENFINYYHKNQWIEGIDEILIKKIA